MLPSEFVIYLLLQSSKGRKENGKEINITPENNDLSLLPGNQAATTTRETDSAKFVRSPRPVASARSAAVASPVLSSSPRPPLRLHLHRANQGSRCARQPSWAGWAGQKSCLDWREADNRPGACSPASTWWNFTAPRGENERSNRQEGSQNWKGTEDGTGRNGVSRTSLSGFTRTQRANWRDRTGCLLLGSLGGRQSFAAPITQAGSGRSWASFAVALPDERAPPPRVRLPGPGA